ncbi:hypothetical protein ACL58G_01635 [Massilia sp. GER05]|uniref:hypothetical protein n=1 Tax=Massilia sp. GER05 TaxID=3394605 RepID=UPI003F875154
MTTKSVLGIALALLFSQASAQQSDDEVALAIADSIVAPEARSSEWHAKVEAGVQKAADPSFALGHLSFDVMVDHKVAPSLSFVFADRLDVNRGSSSAYDSTVNTLKEAYGSVSYSSERIIDFGRINVRSGVAFGYNPTDFFRAGSIRTISSIDPESLRSNRLGSVMLRGQTLSEAGSLTMLYSPKLAGTPSTAPFDIDLGATNAVDRWQVALSPRLGTTSSSTLLIFGEKGQSPTVGVNQTWAVGGSTVAYIEAASRKSIALLDRALARPAQKALYTQLAAGLRITTAQKQSITLEYEYSGASLSRAQWDVLRSRGQADYARYRQWLDYAQELPTKQALFIYGNWQDAGVAHFDVSVMTRRDMADRSHLDWIEGRYRMSRADLILQGQRNRGDARSTFGALPNSNILVIKLLTYF